MLGILKENTEIFGVDLGTSAARVVQLKKSFGKFELVAFGSAPLPQGAIASDSKIDQEAVAKILKDLVHSTNIDSKNVVAALPGNAVFTTVVKIPKMPLSEVEKAVRYQAEQNIPLKINDVKIDWQVIRESDDKSELSVMIIAAPLNRVEKMINIMELAGLELAVLEIEAIATSRSLQTSEPLYMILNLGKSMTEISIVEAGVVAHVRSIPIGGIALTRAIAQGLGMDEEQAEQFKRKFGILPDKMEGQLRKATEPILKNIVEEIERSIKFYNEQFQKNVTFIKITGGTSRLEGLQDYLSEELGLGVAYGNPWSLVAHRGDITTRLSQNALEFSTAVGLAMREF